MLLEDYSMTKEIEFVITFFFFVPPHIFLSKRANRIHHYIKYIKYLT